jgi:hypothetical protein
MSVRCSRSSAASTSREANSALTRGLRSLRRWSLPIATGISSEPCPRSRGPPITVRVGTVRGIRVGTPATRVSATAATGPGRASALAQLLKHDGLRFDAVALLEPDISRFDGHDSGRAILLRQDRLEHLCQPSSRAERCRRETQEPASERSRYRRPATAATPNAGVGQR